MLDSITKAVLENPVIVTTIRDTVMDEWGVCTSANVLANMKTLSRDSRFNDTIDYCLEGMKDEVVYRKKESKFLRHLEISLSLFQDASTRGDDDVDTRIYKYICIHDILARIDRNLHIVRNLPSLKNAVYDKLIDFKDNVPLFKYCAIDYLKSWFDEDYSHEVEDYEEEEDQHDDA
jgi:hypothetical protein